MARAPFLTVAFLSFLLAFLVAQHASAAPETPVISIITTDQGSARVSGEGPDIAKWRPGWQIELFRLVEKKAGVKFEFRRTTWKDALEQVRNGKADAAFNSSYKPERAVYGVYPTRDGELDPGRGTLNYTYWLYHQDGAPVSWNGVTFDALSKPIAAESSAAIVSILRDHGANVIEADTYAEILRLLETGKVEAIAGFEGNVDVFLQTSPLNFSKVVRHPVPLVRRTGYLMFSKIFYAENAPLAERIWNTIAEVWSSPTAVEIRRSYE